MKTAHLRIFGPLALAVLLWTGGCGGDNPSQAPETDEPAYNDGQQLARQGRTQEALASYLKVIARRGDQAPESHLNAGLIYLEQIKDPIAAIYYFRKYIELQPNSRLTDRVKGLIETAKRDFARTLSVQPQEGQAGRFDVLDQMDRLQRENDELKAELGSIRAGSTAPPAAHRAAEDTPADAAGWRPVAAAPEAPAVPQTPSAPSVPRIPPPSPAGPPPGRIQSPARASRTHTVVKGDTWYNLAKRYCGSGSRWPEIVAANRDQLQGDRPPLRIGMVLKLP